MNDPSSRPHLAVATSATNTPAKPTGIPIPKSNSHAAQQSYLKRSALEPFSPVTENGSFEFDRIIKAGEVLKRTRKTKVSRTFLNGNRRTCVSRGKLRADMIAFLCRTGNQYISSCDQISSQSTETAMNPNSAIKSTSPNSQPSLGKRIPKSPTSTASASSRLRATFTSRSNPKPRRKHGSN